MFLNCVSFQRNFSLLFTWVKGALQLTFNGVFSSRGMGVESTGWGCRGRFPGPPCVSPGRQSGGNVNVTTHLWGGNAVLLYYLACFCCFYSAQAPPLHWRLRAALNDWGKLLNDATDYLLWLTVLQSLTLNPFAFVVAEDETEHWEMNWMNY